MNKEDREYLREERAAIIQYDGGHSKVYAEAMARKEMKENEGE